MRNDNNTFAVVTGAGSGIGRAVAIELSKDAVTVLAVGRRAAPLEETAAMAPGKVLTLGADVGTESGRSTIVKTFGECTKVKYLVHAAGIFPIERLTDITAASWRQAMATNLDARLFLTQALIPKLTDGGRVLFVGSMSASKARKGSTAYCTSLAASFMLHQCLKLELADRDIRVTSAIPGPVNTTMLQHGMAADSDVFPDSTEYDGLRRAGKLIEPTTVARFYRWLLTKTDDEIYTAHQWDIRDESHHKAWLATGALYAGGARRGQ
ncbi:MAG: SDR family oxidoreductase [Acidiferrobacterales bacterium]